MIVRDEAYGVGIPFLGTGLLFLLGGLFVLLSNMKVRIGSNEIVATKTLLGIPYSVSSVLRQDVESLKGTEFLWVLKKGGGDLQISPAFETEEACVSAANEIGIRTGIAVTAR